MSHINDDLLVKYLLGEATEGERAALEEWINNNEANKKHFEHFRLIWDESRNIASNSKVNVDDAWAKFRKRTEATEQNETKVIEFPAKKFSWVRAAAILAIVMGMGWMAYMIGANNNAQMMVVNSGNSVRTDTLPDGSIVTLNKNSSITYQKKMTDNTRSVKLEGEAFFNVAPDKAHPFVIDVNDALVTVVGTSFNIKSTESKTEVIVATGVVDVSKNEHAVRLRPNEKATVLINEDAPIKGSNGDELYNYYKTKKFECRGTTLSRLVDVLSEAYEVDIVIANTALNNLSFNTIFEMDSLDETLNTIQTQYPQIQVSKQGEKYILQ